MDDKYAIFDMPETEIQNKQLKGLLQTKLASYKMTWQTREETYQFRKERDIKNNVEFPTADDSKALKMLTNLLKDTEDEIKKLGGTDEDIKKAISETVSDNVLDRKELLKRVKHPEKEDNISEEGKEEPVVDDFKIEYEPSALKEDIEETEINEDNATATDAVETLAEDISSTDAKITTDTITDKLFDTIPLPSKGECYKNKSPKIPVSYLTAYDENLIVSPNLYDDGTFIDVLLKNKIMYKDFDTESLLPGDRDAIILWLRASGYGNEFPVTATDNETGKQFDTVVDLSKINYKPFNLKGDENGYFDFTLPVSKDKIKFRFLTFALLKKLQKMNEADDKGIRKNSIEKNMEVVEGYITEDNRLAKDTKEKLLEAVNRIQKYGESITENTDFVSKAVTNKLSLCIVSVNGMSNRQYIAGYVDRMPARDSYALRTYITNNEPGIDFNVSVKRPESLGGGSVSLFLTLDQFLFFNITEQ